jgi:hypothetical protein
MKFRWNIDYQQLLPTQIILQVSGVVVVVEVERISDKGTVRHDTVTLMLYAGRFAPCTFLG